MKIESQRIIGILIKAIETYQNRVDDLSKTVESLKSENAILKSQLENKNKTHNPRLSKIRIYKTNI